MTKRQLQTYRDIVAEISEQEERLYMLDCKAQKITTRLSDEPHVESQIHDSMAETIATKVDLLNAINRTVSASYKLLRDIEMAIESLPAIEKRLIRMRYMDGMRWESICVDMGYEWAQTHRIHASALQNLGAT